MSSPRLVIWTIALACSLPVVSAWAAGETEMVSCGAGVRAVIVDCGKAKRLVREHLKTHRRSIWMYTCTSGEKRGRCVLDRKLVTFRL